MVNFCWVWRIAHTSSLPAYLLRRFFRIPFFWLAVQSRMICSTVSSLWAATHSVTCNSTLGHLAEACTVLSWIFLSISSPALITNGSWVPAHQAAPILTPSRIDLTVSMSSLVVILLRTSATVLLCPFCYLISKVYWLSDPTQLYLITSRFGIVIIYVSGLLSVWMMNGFHFKCSLKCLVIAHFSTRNSNLEEW